VKPSKGNFNLLLPFDDSHVVRGDDIAWRDGVVGGDYGLSLGEMVSMSIPMLVVVDSNKKELV
jgi:hypothetical protein